MSTVETLTIRRPSEDFASVAEAKESILKRFAGYRIASFKTEEDHSGQSFYSALITKKSDHPQAGLPEPPMPGGLGPDPALPSEGDTVDPENVTSEDNPDAEAAKPKEDKGDSKIHELETKLDHLLNLVEKLTGGEDKPDELAEPELPNTEHPGKPHHELPPPAQEPIGPGAGGPMGMFGSKLAGRMQVTAVRDDAKNVTIKTAKAELDATFNPYGFKVVKMVRRDDKIVAGLIRVNAN